LLSLMAVILYLREVKPGVPAADASASGSADQPEADGFAKAFTRLWPSLLIGAAAAMAAIMVQQLTAFR
ncbi:hypothetical protein, partial [Streptococcus pneumoniae]|uniref:hypothetical protein n=1 Tax=Streptococcus pneumoniae TaxID=1313 RepID=UPI0013DBE65B